MYLCVKQQLNHLTKDEYSNLKELCHIAKNLYNVGLYNVRQYYFEHKEYLKYESNYHLAKTNENYKLLNSNMAQQILKEVDGVFKSFFGLIKLAKQGKYDFKSINLPRYLKKDGYYPLVIGFVRLNGNQLTIPYSNLYKKHHAPIIINIPPILLDKKIKEIRIVPKNNARFFEIQYTYEVAEEQRDLNYQKALAIDLGLNNLATCVTTERQSFIVDGRKLKSINQWFNKENARLQSIKDKQKIKGTTRKQSFLTYNRNNKVNDYINKTCRYIINYCLENQIGNLVIGYAETLQRNINLGRITNQNFVNIPVGNIKEKLEYLCKLYGIKFFKQEESYTSKASFFDNDEIPKYNADNPKDYQFSGKRVKRGLYKTKSGKLVNADINGALNILAKSKAVDITVLCSSGEVATPQRIRIA
ncbi:RNA-guided endonuclease InsQ/TnpB family protein [Bacillus tuaregi]|uniref:RNA-guided endonuclease InsQ/TnpB family protein n=1 Tax=Bacillus tuaregi TaxID=1816695 RepID=UPI0008F88B65|nr:RNA-guided endonuclease TnpB family protein [Bacillus tuaregi]